MAIIPTGSVEQHLNHLFIGMDINSATRIAQDLAEKFSDDVIFYRPLNAIRYSRTSHGIPRNYDS